MKCTYYDRDKFPCVYEEAQAQREDTIFEIDFSIARQFGDAAVRDTYDRAFKAWKNNAKFLVELCTVINHLSWTYNEIGNHGMSEWCANKYYECYNALFNGDFSEEEKSFAFEVLD